jgi:hypothetical protein
MTAVRLHAWDLSRRIPMWSGISLVGGKQIDRQATLVGDHPDRRITSLRPRGAVSRLLVWLLDGTFKRGVTVDQSAR